MTNDEALVLSCAQQIQQYCQERDCHNCIFDGGAVCMIDTEPSGWLIPEREVKEG